MEDMEAFARLVTALRPWLGQLVVVGGWAHRLHRFHRLATPPDHLPLRTRDADLAFSPDEALAGDVRTALTDAGFTEQLFGDDAPPATHYRTRRGGRRVLRGVPDTSLRQRDEAREARCHRVGQPASRRRSCGTWTFCSLKPWSVRVGPEREVPIAADVELFVPNPTSFIVQKLLIHSDRPPHKKAQDILYIHDTLELFGGSLGELRRLWLEDVRPAMPAKTARRAEAVARELFAEVTDTIREAARIPQDRQLAPENVQRACEYGLSEIVAA